MIGEQILNYKVEKLLSESQLSKSYLATHTQFPKKVIIKTYTSEIFDNQHTKELFMEEVKQLSHIQHPNIVTFYDYSEQNNQFNLFFEYVEANTLSDYIRQVSGPIPEAKTKRIMLQIIEALSYSQNQGLMNGSIASSHILVKDENNIKVLESALSNFQRLYDADSSDVELISSISPEQLRKERLTQSSDVYSLGILLFQMLTGKNPYQNKSKEEIIREILNVPLPEMKAFYPMISTEMQIIVNKATAKNPQQRFQSIAELKKAILDIEIYKEEQIKKELEQRERELLSNKKVIIEQELDLSKVRFVNAPLFTFLGLFAIVLLLFYLYNNPGRTLKSEVLINLQDTNRIKSKSDSIDKARAKKELEDSIRIAKLSKRKDSTKIHIHKVKPGETLESIAGKFYISVDTLQRLNDMRNVKRSEKLEPKYGIRVKVRDIHVMRKDETLDKVAFKYAISKLILLQTNSILNEKEDIYEGKNIVIPIIAGR